MLKKENKTTNNRFGSRGYKRSPAPQGNKKPLNQPKKIFIPDLKKDEIRILMFGGVSEIGKNMYALEYNDTIILIECGTMFGESTTPGVNNVMPSIQYLKDNKRKIKALVLTDTAKSHTGAVPYSIVSLGNPTIYSRESTKFVVNNANESAVRRAPSLNFNVIEKDCTEKINDDVSLSFFGVCENQPKSLGVLIETRSGCVAYMGSVMPENKKGIISQREEDKFKIFKDKKVLLSMADSINAERAGFSSNDSDISKTVLKMIKDSPSRVLLPLFPSQIKRNSLILEGAVELGRKIYVEGNLLMKNLQMACEHDILKIDKDLLVSIDKMDDSSDIKKDLIVTSGAEDEIYEMLENMSRESCRHTKVIGEDSVIFSSSILQKNTRGTQDLWDRLSRFGAIIHEYTTTDSRGSAHPCREDLIFMHRIVNPKYFIPVQGYNYMLLAHTHILRDIGVPLDDCPVLESGSIARITEDGIDVLKRKLSSEIVSVDSNAPFVVQGIVVQDRVIMSEEGILVVILFLDVKKKTLRRSPDMLSYGFAYLRNEQDLVSKIKLSIKKIVEEELKDSTQIEMGILKKSLQKGLQSFLVNEVSKKPIIIPVIFT